MSSLKVTQVAPRHSRGTTFIGQDGSTTHFHPHSRVILHEYATKEWILEMLGDLEGADLSELVTKKYAHETFGEIFIGTKKPLGVKETDLWFDTSTGEQHLKMCNRVDRDADGNVIGYNWINVAPRPSVDDDVQSLKEDVVTLEGEIEALITLDEKGSWVATSNDPPQSGQVQFSSSDFSTSPMTVKISKSDTDGTSHTFATAGVGTWIEFVEDDQDYCLGRITSVIRSDDFFTATFDVSVSKGLVHDGNSIKVRLFEAADDFDPASIRIVDINDSPPIDPNEGALWFDNNEEDMTLRVYQKDSEAWIPVAPATTIEGRVAAGEATQRVIQSTIDKALMDQALISAKPPGVKFNYQTGSSGLNDMCFQWFQSDSRLRISSKGVDVDWLADGFTFDYDMSYGPYFTIWYMPSIASVGDRPQWKVRKHGRIDRIDWHKEDILCYLSSSKSNGNFSGGATYYITIGGII